MKHFSQHSPETENHFNFERLNARFKPQKFGFTFFLTGGQLLYNIGVVFPYINVKWPQAYLCPLPPEPSPHLPSYPFLPGCQRVPALGSPHHMSNSHWLSILHLVIYMFQRYSLKSSHPHLLPRSPKVCYLYLFLFCCLAYRFVVIVFLNSIYMC